MAARAGIVLKKVGGQVSNHGLALVHEVAHSLHHAIDRVDKGRFSQNWFKRYRQGGVTTSATTMPPEPARSSWRGLQLEQLQTLGSLEGYAEFDTSSDTPIDVQTSGEKVSCLSKAGLTLFYEPQELTAITPPELLLKTLLRDRDNLPERMAESLSVVTVDPTASVDHFNPAEEASEWYGRIREDVATHAEGFTRVALFPKSNVSELRRIRSEAKLQSKVEDLAKAGFIKAEAANYLLDSSAPINGSYGAGWKKGTVFPPFIGTVPEVLPSNIMRSAQPEIITIAPNGKILARLVLDSEHHFFSSVSYPSQFKVAPVLADFIAGRSDLGVHYFLVGPSHRGDANSESIWLYHSAWASTDHSITENVGNLEQRIRQEFLRQT